MKELILLRHAKSSWDYAVSDRNRPLTEKGMKRITNMATASASLFKKQEIIFSSPANRAMHTATLLIHTLGIAFENAYDKNPDIVLHKEYDGSHPSLLGTYLAACVVFSSITHKSPLQIQYDYFGKIAEDDKKFLQKVAKNTVEDFYGIKL